MASHASPSIARASRGADRGRANERASARAGKRGKRATTRSRRPSAPPGRDGRPPTTNSTSEGDDDADPEAPLGRRSRRPVLRVGARAQTLPPPEGRHVSEKRMKKVALEGAARRAADAPAADGVAEVALIGRSNVGKSSLLNLVTFGAGAAVVSAKPGTTCSMNHYSVDGRWRLVDLPGYGYAEAEPGEIEAWDAFTKEYFATRENLAGVLLLIDASVPPTANDEKYANWLIENETPFTIVFTKCDRDKPKGPSVEDNKAAFRAKLEERWHRLPSMISTSSVTTQGRDEVLKFISSLIVYRRMRNEERKKAKRQEKVKAMKEERYEAKGEAMRKARGGKPAKKPVSKVEEEWDDEEELDEDWDDESSFTVNAKGKGAKTIQDMIRAELEEINREGR